MTVSNTCSPQYNKTTRRDKRRNSAADVVTTAVKYVHTVRRHSLSFMTYQANNKWWTPLTTTRKKTTQLTWLQQQSTIFIRSPAIRYPSWLQNKQQKRGTAIARDEPVENTTGATAYTIYCCYRITHNIAQHTTPPQFCRHQAMPLRKHLIEIFPTWLLALSHPPGHLLTILVRGVLSTNGDSEGCVIY